MPPSAKAFTQERNEARTMVSILEEGGYLITQDKRDYVPRSELVSFVCDQGYSKQRAGRLIKNELKVSGVNQGVDKADGFPAYFGIKKSNRPIRLV